MNEIHLNIRRPAWMELDGFEKAGQATVSEFRRSIVAKKCLASQKIVYPASNADCSHWEVDAVAPGY